MARSPASNLKAMRLLLAFVGALASTASLATEPGGVVLVASGAVHADKGDSKPRALARGAEFFPGETLTTGPAGQAQVRFRDGTVLSLRSATKLRVDALARDRQAPDANGRAAVTLIKGGFRALTGAADNQEAARARVETSVATLAVRGTDYEVALADELHIAVWHGAVTVRNDAGAMDLGMDAGYDYAVVRGAHTAPQGLLEPPSRLGAPLAAAASSATNGADDTQLVAEDSGNAALGKKLDHRLQTPEFDSALPRPEADFIDATAADALVSASVEINDNLTDKNGDGNPDVFEALSDERLSDAELASLDRLGLGVAAGASNPHGAFLAQASDGDSPVFADKGLLPDDPHFKTLFAERVIRQGTAPLADGSPLTHAKLPVTLGRWDGNAEDPVLAQTDPADPEVFTPIERDLYWVTALPTDVDILDGLNGSRTFNRSLNVMGSSYNGAIDELDINLEVDFTDARVAGAMGLKSSAGDYWALKVNGQLRGPYLNLQSQSDSKLYNDGTETDSIDGELGAVLSGADGTAIAGMFDVAGVNDTSRHAEGVFLAGRDARLSDSEAAAVDRLGFAVIDGAGALGTFTGRATDGRDGSPVILDIAVAPADHRFPASAAVNVIRQGSAPDGGTQTNNTYDVAWGAWSGSGANPVIQQTDASDATVDASIDKTVLWTTVPVSEPATIADLSGQVRYRNVIAFQGNSTAGNIDAIYGSTEVDFSNGDADSEFHVHANGDFWDMVLSGAVDGNTLAMAVNASDSELVSKTDGTLPVDGVFQSAFTGDDGEALAGSFDFQTTSGALHDTDGVFLVDNADVGDLRLSATERSNLTYKGFAAVGGSRVVHPLAVAPLNGTATDGSDGSPVLVGSDLDPTSNFPKHLLRQGDASLSWDGANPSVLRTDTDTTVTLPVSWGTWNEAADGNVLDQEDANDPLLSSNIGTSVHWLTAEPTDAGVVSELSGMTRYKSAITLNGSSNLGALSSGNGNWLVDFDTGAVSGSLSFIAGGADEWNINVEGAVDGANLDISSVDGDINNTAPINGTVNGYLVGPKAEGIAGIFDVEGASDPARHAEGNFVLDCGTLCP